MSKPDEQHEFDVTVVVHGKVPARNGGDAIHLLAELVRGGLGPEGDRRFEATIAEGQATRLEVTARAIEDRGV